MIGHLRDCPMYWERPPCICTELRQMHTIELLEGVIARLDKIEVTIAKASKTVSAKGSP